MWLSPEGQEEQKADVGNGMDDVTKRKAVVVGDMVKHLHAVVGGARAADHLGQKIVRAIGDANHCQG